MVSRWGISIYGTASSTRSGQGRGEVGPLYDRLRNLKVSREGGGRADLSDAALMLLLADKGTQSQTIATVLKTAGMAGFYNVRFGVISR